MLREVEKRLSPRITMQSFLKLFPGGREAKVLNINETGACLECDDPDLSQETNLTIDLSPLNSKQLGKITAKVVWKTALPNNRFRFGIRFSSSNSNHSNQVREFVFDYFVKKATFDIEDEMFRNRAENFIKVDLKNYHENLLALVQEQAERKVKPEEVEKRLKVLTDDILLKGDDLEKAADNQAYIKKIKNVFREIAGCWFYKSPIVKMAYDKPRGYPGDYQLFEMIYDNESRAEEGSIGYYCDRYFLRNTYGQAARARKNKMKNILQDLIENSDLESVKLLNVACGPSREIRELLSDPYLSAKKKLFFTGLDNDEEALRFSQSKLNHRTENIQVRLLHENVLNIFRDKKYYDIIGKQDIIYILGLTEYLPDRIFRRLTRFLFELLNNNGMLVITYKDEAIRFPSLPPDWFCDWNFVKRTKEDLIKTAEEIGSNQYTLKIEREGTGTIFFLILTKK